LHPPTVAGRDPVWENPADQPVVVGLRSDVRDVLVTHVLDAEPDHRMEFPAPSIWPFLTAVATTGLFIGSIFTPWAVVYGAVPVFITMVGWFWPKSANEGGTPPWPVVHRTLPRPNEDPAIGGAI
jgi:cytochrome c oxidase subunit 1